MNCVVYVATKKNDIDTYLYKKEERRIFRWRQSGYWRELNVSQHSNEITDVSRQNVAENCYYFFYYYYYYLYGQSIKSLLQLYSLLHSSLRFFPLFENYFHSIVSKYTFYNVIQCLGEEIRLRLQIERVVQPRVGHTYIFFFFLRMLPVAAIFQSHSLGQFGVSDLPIRFGLSYFHSFPVFALSLSARNSIQQHPHDSKDKKK